MGLFKVPASRGLILLTASAIRTHFEVLNVTPALHFSGITMGIANEYAKRLRVPADIQQRLIENVWPHVLSAFPQLRDLFPNFAVCSVNAMEIWASADDEPQCLYFDRWFSKSASDVTQDEFEHFFSEFSRAFEELIARKQREWRSGK